MCPLNRTCLTSKKHKCVSQKFVNTSARAHLCPPRAAWLPLAKQRATNFFLLRQSNVSPVPHCQCYKVIVHGNMPRFSWPGHKLQLLGGLQKLQSSNEFCDTLLQTEGISVPTHSCVLAALSPYLSEKLSASPSPPSGQRHRVQLCAVKAQTLLKLVGLLYSGELEVKGSVEQSDVLAAARRFGITNLVEGQKLTSRCNGGENGVGAEESRGRGERGEMKDAQVQAEVAESRETDCAGEERSCVSTGTQTVTVGEKSADSCVALSTQTTPPTPESTPSGAQTSMHSGASSELEVTSNQHSSSLTNSSLEFGDSMSVLSEEGTELENKKRDGRDDGEQLVQADEDEMADAEGQESAEKEHGDVRVVMKSLAEMKRLQQAMQTTHTSVKVKLRRKTEGKIWEVVNIQDSDETSALTSLTQDGCSSERPEESLPNNHPPPPTHEAASRVLQPAASDPPNSPAHPNTTADPPKSPAHPNTTADPPKSPAHPNTTADPPKSPAHPNTTPEPPKSPAHPNTTPDPQPPSGDCFGLEAAPAVQQQQGSVEESDEQIEKLLEDIMMGLNILPTLDSKKSQSPPQSHSRVLAGPRVPAPQNDTGHSQIPASLPGIHSFLTAQNQLSCSSLSSVLPDGVLQLQQHEYFPPNHLSIRSMWQLDGMSQQCAPLLKSHEGLHPEPSTIRSVAAGARLSTEQKQHYPALHEASSLDNQHILQLLPLSNETYSHPPRLPCLDDLRLPRCLSPLQTFTSSTKYSPSQNIPANLGIKIQPSPSLHGPPWLTENPGSLDSSLSAVNRKENKSASLQQETTLYCWSKQRQDNLALNPKSCMAKGVEGGQTASAGQQNVSGLKPDRRRIKEGDTPGHAVPPKKRKRTHPNKPQDAAGSVSANVKVSDAVNSHINLSVCQVSLSSNNVLAKERELASSSLKSQSKSVEEPNQPSSITESQRKKPRGKTGPSRIGTRGFLKKALELSDTNPGTCSLAKPVAHSVKTVDKEGVQKRKRGRPPKKGPASPENHSEESRQKTDNSLTKEDSENKDKTRKRYKRRRISRNTDLRSIELKSSTSTESTSKPDEDVEVVKRPQMVNLKDFKNLIRRQRSKMRRSNKSQETNETVRDGQNEPRIIVDRNHNLISNEVIDAMKRTLQEIEDSSRSKETGLFGEKPSVFAFDVLEEEVAQIAAEGEQPLQGPDEGTTCNAAEWDPAQRTVISDAGLTCSDTDLLSHPTSHPQTPLEDAGGSSGTSSSDEEQEEQEEEEEDVEVDDLLYSPVKVPQTREHKDGPNTIDFPQEEEEGGGEEEEDEDTNEIDVTGDDSQ